MVNHYVTQDVCRKVMRRINVRLINQFVCNLNFRYAYNLACFRLKCQRLIVIVATSSCRHVSTHKTNN